MATISNLIVNMIARTANYESGMKKSSAITKSFQRTVAGVTGTIRNMAVGFLAAAGIGGIGYMIKQTADMIDNTRDMSIAMGVSTEFLTGMGYAAKQSGASIDEIGNALKFMNKNIFEARQGSKEMLKTFNSLGLSTKRLQVMTPEQTFIGIVDALSKIPDAAQRTNAALTIFGKGGGGLLPLIMEGKTGIQAMLKEAERLGITFNSFDAAKVDAMNDSFESMKMAVQGIANSFVIYLAPYAQAVYETITDMLVPMKSFTISAAATADRFEAFKTFAILAINPIMMIQQSLNGVKILLLGIGLIVSDIIRGFSIVGSSINVMASNMEDYFLKKIKEIRKENQEISKDILKNIIYILGLGNESTMDKFFDKIEQRQKELQANYKKHPAGIVGAITEPVKQRSFQEINPSMINVASLYPKQDPVVSELKIANNNLREIKNGMLG